jgi:hypothetical protein
MMSGEMTGLLTPPSVSGSGSASDGRRPIVVGAALAGACAAGAVLVGAMAVALVAWFATDRGSHGTTTDALRIGSDAWLLAHGSSLDLGVANITAIPLGLTLICAYVCYRLGRWAGATSHAEDARAVGYAAFVMAAVYGLVALVVALLATVPGAEPHLGRAFAGAFLVAALSGSPGLLSGSGHLAPLLERVPETLRATAYAGAVAALSVLAAGSVLVAVTLLLDLGTGANVLSRLHADASGAALYTVLVAGVAPNAALFGAAFLVGPGFVVGTGTVVSTSEVVLGPVPAFPLLAALPSAGTQPWWTLPLLGVPVLCGVVAGVLAVRSYPCARYGSAAVRGLAGGMLGGLLQGLAMAGAGGAVGPGRMEDVGPETLACTVAAVVALGLGATIGAVLTHWRRGPAPDGSEPTVDLTRESADEPTVDLAAMSSPAEPDSGAGEPTVRVRRSLLGRVTGPRAKK